jgi:hypothetical protein
MSSLHTRRIAVAALALALAVGVSPAWAQDPPPVVVTGGLDMVNQYNFRGIRQNADGVSIWPYIDFGFTPYRGDGSLKTVGVNLGTWNAFNSEIDGFTNRDGETTGNKWYESDLYATVSFGLGTPTLAVTYTSYTSPANLFSHVKELAFKVSADDSAVLGRAALKPYALIAFELGTKPGLGQADGGPEAGRYVELGVAPGFSGSRASFALPVKLGLSVGDYYELDGEDHKFGYFSVAGLVTVPMGSQLNVHGGVEFQALGETTEFLNGGDASQIIGSIGLGFAF